MSRIRITSLLHILQTGFDDINNHLDRELKIKEHNNTKLMNFQKEINTLNFEIHKTLRKRKIITKNENTASLRYQIQVNISRIYVNMITFISLWSINLWQGMISRTVIKNSIGNLLAEEHIVLESAINKLLALKGAHYADAWNCYKLLNICENKDTFKKLKHFTQLYK